MEQKKKTRNLKVGDVLKGKTNPKTDKPYPDYVKLNVEHQPVREALQAALSGSDKGLFLDLKSKKSQLEDYEASVAAGRLNPSDDWVTKLHDRLEKIPDFVRFEIYLRVEKD